jgi:glucose-6-phosphate-specific signal transduction histidine kinase
MMILGMNLLIGGLIVTVITAGESNLFFYIMQPLSRSSVLGLALTLTGFLILVAGFFLVIHYDRQRSWHLKQIEKSMPPRDRKNAIKTADELLKQLTDKPNDYQ